VTRRRSGGCCCGPASGFCAETQISQPADRVTTSIGVDWQLMSDGYWLAPETVYSGIDDDCIVPTGGAPASLVSGPIAAQHQRIVVPPLPAPPDDTPCATRMNTGGRADAVFTLTMTPLLDPGGGGDWSKLRFVSTGASFVSTSCQDSPTFTVAGRTFCGSYNENVAPLPGYPALER